MYVKYSIYLKPLKISEHVFVCSVLECDVFLAPCQEYIEIDVDHHFPNSTYCIILRNTETVIVQYDEAKCLVIVCSCNFCI